MPQEMFLDALPAESPVSLAHTLQSRHVSMISFGGIIGAGLFVGSSAAIATAGPAVLLTYTMCGLLVFLIMRMLGEMAVARPGLGSFAEYSAASLGHWAGFMNGWLYWYFWVITVGIETIAGANVISHWIPAPVWVIGLVLIMTMMSTNLLSVRLYGECEFWFAFIKVASIALFIVLGLGYVFGFGIGPVAAVHVLTGHGGLVPLGASAIFLAIPNVIFAMMGSEVATIAAAETADPASNVARSARTVSLRILFFYVASVALIVSIVPWNTVIPGESPFVFTMNAMHIPGASLAMQVIVLTAVLSCLNSGLYVTSRMVFELAKRGDAPQIFLRVSGSRVPRLGILLGSSVGFLAALSSIVSPTLVFLFLINTSGAIILFIYLLIALSQIAMRRRLERQKETLKLKVWCFPALSYLVVASIVAVFVMMMFAPGQFVQVAASGFSVVFIYCAFLVRRKLG